jgi:hypothetical protein
LTVALEAAPPSASHLLLPPAGVCVLEVAREVLRVLGRLGGRDEPPYACRLLDIASRYGVRPVRFCTLSSSLHPTAAARR